MSKIYYLKWRLFNALTLILAGCCCLLGFAGSVVAEEKIWILENNLGIGSLPADAEDVFLRPELWEEAGKHVGVYFFRVHELSENPIYTDDYLKNHLIPVLKEKKISIGIEVWGALWAQGTMANGEVRGEYYRKREARLIRRIHSLGGEVEYINLLSVLSKKPKTDNCRDCEIYTRFDEESILRRAEDIAEYVLDMKSKFPGIKIGELDSLIRFNKWRDGSGYRLVNSVLKKRQVELDFWIIDLPYELPHDNIWGLSWSDIVNAQNIVQDKLSSQFGVVIASQISSDHKLKPGQSLDQGETDASQTHINTLQFIDEFRKAGGRPDIYFSNLYFPEPTRLLPDSDPNVFSQMRMIKEIGESLQGTVEK